MTNPKIKVNRKLQKENYLPERTKMLKEINKMTGNQLKVFPACQVQRVVVRKSVPEFRQEIVRKDSLCKAFRSQASQTDLGTPNEYEGVVRYPSSRIVEVRPKKEVGMQVEESSPHFYLDEEVIRRNRSPENHVRVNHVRVNQMPVIKPKLVFRNKKRDPCRAPPTYQRGVVPKYLQKLKEEEDIEKYVRKKSSVDIDFKDKDQAEKEEKMKKLASWHESYKRMVSDLNMLSAVS